jgi:hypothetical protein
MDEHDLRVLVVDDERAIRRFLRASLSAHGYTVFEAGNGQEALAAVLTDRPDLVQAAYGSIIPPGVEILDVDATVTWWGYRLMALSLRHGFVTYDTVACREGWLGFGSWPKAATGEALSVTRIDPTRYGNDPNNWQAAAPSPGQ